MMNVSKISDVELFFPDGSSGEDLDLFVIQPNLKPQVILAFPKDMPLAKQSSIVSARVDKLLQEELAGPPVVQTT